MRTVLDAAQDEAKRLKPAGLQFGLQFTAVHSSSQEYTSAV